MAVKHSMSKDSRSMESVFIQFSGGFITDVLIEQGLKILAKCYRVGKFETLQAEEGWVSGNLAIDARFWKTLERTGEYHREFDGVSVDCEMP